MNIVFGEFLKEKRLEKKLKQEDLAVALNRTNQYISNIEKGKNNAPPDINDIEKLIKVLKLNDKEASCFRMKAAICRNSLPQKQMEYIYTHDALIDLIEYGEKHEFDDEKWITVLDILTRREQVDDE